MILLMVHLLLRTFHLRTQMERALFSKSQVKAIVVHGLRFRSWLKGTCITIPLLLIRGLT